MVNRGAGRVLAVAVIGAVVLGGCSATVDRTGGETTTEPTVLRGITRAGLVMEPFNEALAELSGGSITFEWDDEFHEGVPNGEEDTIAAVRAGTTDWAVVPVRAWRGAGVTSFDALIAPMVIDSLALQDAVLQDGMVDQMVTGVQDSGLIGIGVLPGPMRKPSGITRDLLVPSDYQGAVVVMSKGDVPDRSLRALGATTALAAADIDLTLYDGIEGQVESIGGNEYDEVVKTTTTNVNLWPRPYVIVGNAAAAESLTDEQLGILKAAARQAIPATTERHVQLENEEVGNLCRRSKLSFISATPQDMSQLREAFASVTAWLAEDAETEVFLQRIDDLRKNLPADAVDQEISCVADDSVSSGSPTPDVVAGVTPLDGRWAVSMTEEEYAAAGADEGEMESSDNWGDFWIEFDAGQFRSGTGSGEGDDGSEADEASDTSLTFRVDGDTVTIESSTGKQEKFMMGWSVYKDTLTFSRVPGGVTPTAFVAKPWTRVGDGG